MALICAALFCLVVIAALMSRPASAHEWYSNYRDPVWGVSCCGGHDCARVDASHVSISATGYRIVLTLEQAKAINPYATRPLDAEIPMERVQISEDGQYHICLMAAYHDDDRREGVFCFFAPPGT